MSVWKGLGMEHKELGDINDPCHLATSLANAIEHHSYSDKWRQLQGMSDTWSIKAGVRATTVYDWSYGERLTKRLLGTSVKQFFRGCFSSNLVLCVSEIYMRLFHCTRRWISCTICRTFATDLQAPAPSGGHQVGITSRHTVVHASARLEFGFQNA